MSSPRLRFPILLALLAVVVIAAGCGGDDDDGGGGEAVEPPEDVRMADEDAAPGEDVMAITLTSSAFAEGEAIPVEFTCDGAGDSPPLEWSGVTANAESLALLVLDLDAPGGTFLHWSVYGVGSSDTSFPAGAAPAGSLQGQNDTGDDGYSPPCPPEGDGPHRYEFSLHALPASPGLDAGAAPDQAVEAIEGSSIESSTLTGTYER
jgi:hypothetical protein